MFIKINLFDADLFMIFSKNKKKHKSLRQKILKQF